MLLLSAILLTRYWLVTLGASVASRERRPPLLISAGQKLADCVRACLDRIIPTLSGQHADTRKASRRTHLSFVLWAHFLFLYLGVVLLTLRKVFGGRFFV